MGVFQTKSFARFANKAKLPPKALLEAASEISAGQWDADLGGGVFKKRLGRMGAGASGGFRIIVCFRHGQHSFFVYGFAKNERANISAKELKALKALAAELFGYGSMQIAQALAAGALKEVVDQDDDPTGAKA